MTTLISSEAQKYHGLDKRTKSVIELMFSFHDKEKRYGYNAKIYARKSRNLYKVRFMSFEA